MVEEEEQQEQEHAEAPPAGGTTAAGPATEAVAVVAEVDVQQQQQQQQLYPLKEEQPEQEKTVEGTATAETAEEAQREQQQQQREKEQQQKEQLLQKQKDQLLQKQKEQHQQQKQKQEEQQQQQRQHDQKQQQRQRQQQKQKPERLSLSWQRLVRDSVTPYLPPPVVTAIQETDAAVLSAVGIPEATISVSATLLLAWVVYQLMKVLSSSRRRGALADDDNDETEKLLMKQETRTAVAAADNNYQATVLLCGPVNSGKTSLFYELCHGQRNLPTLMSLTMNVAISSTSTTKGDEPTQSIRYIDWPGHSKLVGDEGAILQPVLCTAKSNSPCCPPDLRIVLVLDATQPVSTAADVLFQLLCIAYQNYYSKTNQCFQQPYHIFIACHKKDFPKAKNAKRVQLQMRTELERLLKVKRQTKSDDDESDDKNNNDDPTSTLFWPPDIPLELDELSHFAKLCFVATSTLGGGGKQHCSPELYTFCTTGEFPNNNNTAAASAVVAESSSS